MSNDASIREIPLAIAVAPELENLTDLGGNTEPSGFVARVGDSPICHQIPDIFGELGVALPAELKLYDRFRLWLVPHRVALLRRRGLAEPVSVGIEVEYITDGATCSVVSLLPAPQFLHHGNISFDGTVKGSMGISGELTPSPADQMEGGGPGSAGMVAGLGLSARGIGGISLSFSASVVTPFISAVGMGSNRVEWRFDRHQEALFGRDIQTWAIVALPKRKRELRYRIRHNVTTRTLFFPTRTESEWIEVTCTFNI